MKTSLKLTIIAATVIVLGGAAWASAGNWRSAAQDTDDAYVTADYTLVSPRIAGTIGQVLVEDNQHVKAGDVLARIDDRDYQAALRIAQADLEAITARLGNIDARAAQQQAVIGQAAATIAADDAALDFARENATRYRRLSDQGAGTAEQQQQSAFTLRQQMAMRQRDSAVLAAADKELGVLASERVENRAAVGRAQAALDQAKLNLSYTTIVAPSDGVVGQRAVRVGAYVNAGAPLLAVVPLRSVYIVGNFRENQLTNMEPGQPVQITIDAFPGLTLKGRIDSMAPATGVTFSPIAPDNATGNFTKVAQRLPVKITLDQDQPGINRLRVGMSVVPHITTGQHGLVRG